MSQELFFASDPNMNMYIAIAFTAGAFLTNLVSALLFFTALVFCSRNLHQDMFESILSVPMYFFDNNAAGKLMIFSSILFIII